MSFYNEGPSAKIFPGDLIRMAEPRYPSQRTTITLFETPDHNIVGRLSGTLNDNEIGLVLGIFKRDQAGMDNGWDDAFILTSRGMMGWHHVCHFTKVST